MQSDHTDTANAGWASLRRLWPAALLLLTPVLAACGDDDGDGADTGARGRGDETSSAPASSSPAPTSDVSSVSSDAPTSATAPAAGLPAPCDVVSAADVTAAYGEPFAADGVGSSTTSQQGTEWTGKSCNFAVEDRVEVTVRLSGPDDFTKGTFACIAPSDITGNVIPGDVAGATSAWWKTNDAPPLEASLRACTAAAIVEIELEYEDGVDYEGDPQAQTADLMTKVLAKL